MKFIITAVVAAFVATSSVVSGMEAPELRGPVLVRLFYYGVWLNFIAIEHMICSYDMCISYNMHMICIVYIANPYPYSSLPRRRCTLHHIIIILD